MIGRASEPVSGFSPRKTDFGHQRLVRRVSPLSPRSLTFGLERLPKNRLTGRDVAHSAGGGTCPVETALCGWASRIRTANVILEKGPLKCRTNSREFRKIWEPETFGGAAAGSGHCTRQRQSLAEIHSSCIGDNP